MQTNATLTIQKFITNDPNDCYDYFYTLSRNLDASVTLQEKFNSRLNPSLSRADIKKIIDSDKRFIEHYNKDTAYNGIVKSGLYKIYNNNEYIGMLGGSVLSMKDNKISELSVRIQLHKVKEDGSPSTLVGVGFGSKARNMYFEILAKNRNEFCDDAVVSYTTINNNEASSKFQNKIGLSGDKYVSQKTDVYYKKTIDINDFYKNSVHQQSPKL